MGKSRYKLQYASVRETQSLPDLFLPILYNDIHHISSPFLFTRESIENYKSLKLHESLNLLHQALDKVKKDVNDDFI